MSTFPRLRSSLWRALRAFSLITTSVCLTFSVQGQGLDSRDRERGLEMLSAVKKTLLKQYYDPNFHGMDVEARFKEAEEKIKNASSVGQVFGIIAQAFMDLDDSHTWFAPPQRINRTEYGWTMSMVGDDCLVSAVKPGSDAESRGLKPGDLVLAVDGTKPTRQILWKMQYFYYTLRPQAGMRLTVKSPVGEPRELVVLAKLSKGKRVIDLTDFNDRIDLIREDENQDRVNVHRLRTIDDLSIWQMPGFDLETYQVDDAWGKVKKSKAVILDLRGNGGGRETTLQRMIANVFDREIKIGDIKGRKESKPLIAKSRGDSAFKGELIVLVDSESGSAAELFARVVQLEKRGIVIGDRTSGMVMRSRYYDHKIGVDTVIMFGATITIADLIMTDGKSLEHSGVTPDELLLPEPADLAKSRDPVLAKAAQRVGVKLTPEVAGTFFPVQWQEHIK